MENKNEDKNEKKYGNRYTKYYYKQKLYRANGFFVVNIFLLVILFIFSFRTEDLYLSQASRLISVVCLLSSVLSFIFLKTCIDVKDDIIKNLSNKNKEANKNTTDIDQKDN